MELSPQQVMAELPKPVQVVVFGQDVPEMDVAGMRRLGDAWEATAVALENPEAELETRTNTLPLAIDPDTDTGRRMVDTLHRYSLVLPQLRAFCHGMAEECYQTANDTEKSLWSMAIFGLITAQQVAVAMGTTGIWGVIPVLGAARTKFLQMLEAFLARFAENIAARAAWRVGLAVTGYTVLPAVVDTAVQAGQMVTGNRHNLDGRSILVSLASGGGSMGFGFFGGCAAAAWLPARWATAAGGAAIILAESGAGVVGGLLAAAPITGLPTWQEFGQEFAAGAAVGLAGARHGSHLIDPHPEPLGEADIPAGYGPGTREQSPSVTSEVSASQDDTVIPEPGEVTATPETSSVPEEPYAVTPEGADWSILRPGKVDAPLVLTPHDHDRIQQLRDLAEQWGEQAGREDPAAVTVSTVRHKALALVENLGLREGTAGAASHREIIARTLDYPVRGQVEHVLADVGRPEVDLSDSDRRFLAEIQHQEVANLCRMPLDTAEQLRDCRRDIYGVRQEVTKTAGDRSRAATEQLLLQVTVAEKRVEWALRSNPARSTDVYAPTLGDQDRPAPRNQNAGRETVPASDTSQRSPARVLQERHRVLLVSLAWAGPGVGGSATVNRELAAALDRQGYEVFVRVGHPATDWEPPGGVTLIGPRTYEPDVHPIYQLDLDLDLLPPRIDTIIGHKDFSGFAARFIRNVRYPDAGLIHFLHLDDAASQAMQGRELLGQAIQFMNAELTAGADVVTGAGPVLAGLAERFAMNAARPPVVHELIPGIEVTAQIKQPPLKGRPNVLLMCRLDSHHKGVHEAAQIARLVNERGGGIDLTLVGARPETLERSKQILSDIAGQSVEVKPFTSDSEEKMGYLRSAHLMIMPSRIDAFGLVSMEALSAGLPPMAPNTTGFGRFILERFPSEISRRMVVQQDYAGPVHIERWADKIIEATEDVPGLWRAAAEARTILQERNYTWDAAAENLMNALPMTGPIPRHREQ